MLVKAIRCSGAGSCRQVSRGKIWNERGVKGIETFSPANSIFDEAFPGRQSALTETEKGSEWGG
jgi:hypothetical protein